MKKILSLVLAFVLILAVVSLAGCGEKTLSFGVGVYAYRDNLTNAVDGDGQTDTAITVAAVTLDSEGKIVNCAIDCVEFEAKFSEKGESLSVGEIKSKREKGDAYGMKAYGGSKKEWYEQVDAFTELIKGKTAQDVKALVATDNKGNDDVINAGCTIVISDFVKAVEKAINNSAESNVSKDNTLKIGIVATQTDSKNATEDTDGTNQIDTSVTVAALNKDAKVVAAYSDAIQSGATFDIKGANTSASGEITTKRDAKDSYGMASYGQDLNGDGKVKEWYQQAKAFDDALVGKNASQISKLVTDKGYGDEALQTAGCTIAVSDMVKAAVKATTVK